MVSGAKANFLDWHSVAIVCGGSVATVLISFPLGQVLKLPIVLKHAIFTKARDARGLIKELVNYAEIARRDGILSLENSVKDIDDEFLVSGIQMAVDGTDPELIEQILENWNAHTTCHVLNRQVIAPHRTG